MDHDLRCAGVADDIRQRFLVNPEECGGQIRREDRLMYFGVNVALDPGARLKFIRLPFQRRDQPKMIQNSRPQFSGNPAHGLNGRIDVG